MKDSFGNELQIGDYLIVTVSKGSHYLTSAQILSVEEELGKVKVMYSSTIATKWIDPSKNTLKYIPTHYVLDGRKGLCRDCVNKVIEPGMKVAYRNKAEGKSPISFGVVSIVESDLWVILDNGDRVRNVGIFVL